MGDIIWLASYPKSGNTWFRAFLSHLLQEENEEISINKMKTDGIFSSRAIFDDITGIESSDLTADEIDARRPLVYNHLAQMANRQLFVKVHDAYTYVEDGKPLLSTVNSKAIYIIRNPLDVAVSFANHSSKNFNQIITYMGDETFSFCDNKNRLPKQLRQKLLSWHSHVESWTNASELPVHMMRYEDMQADPVKTFTEAVRFIGIDCSEEQIKKAISASDFNKLKAEEEESGFKERISKTTVFFRTGKAGDWRNHLNKEQRDAIITDHGAAMRKFGYLDSMGNLV